MNEHDAERIRAVLEAEGLRQVAAPDDATVIVYNTCTVRESADERFAGHLGTAARLKRDDPGRVVVVTGCLPQADKTGLFDRIPCIDVAVGPQNLDRLADAVRDALGRDGAVPARPRHAGFFEDKGSFSADLPSRRSRPFQAWVQVMSGCTNDCSYCIVPRVRGPERSRHEAEIVAEVTRLVGDGVREVTLLGQNVNAYGADLAQADRGPGGFPALLRAVDGVPGLDRVRFMTSHPKDLGDDLIAALAELATVCEHVHLPAQAGSDPVLAAMNRGYTAAQYLERVAALRRAVPDVSITTDLIAGFPGETEQDFDATLDLVEKAGFDAAFTFVYSPRRGTPAAAMASQVPAGVKRDRVQRLIALTQAQALVRRQRFVGRTVEVLVEGHARQAGRLRGRTRQNVTVNLSGHATPGTIVSVRITHATSTTFRGDVATEDQRD
jgi:tRNA-2-methylthio-N6-dimethylallyladenosine synthase